MVASKFSICDLKTCSIFKQSSNAKSKVYSQIEYSFHRNDIMSPIKHVLKRFMALMAKAQFYEILYFKVVTAMVKDKNNAV